MRHKKLSGFTPIEILLVVAALAILAVLVLTAVNRSRQKAYDNSIRNDVGQLRWQAEIVYDDSGANYKGWAKNPPPEIAEQLRILLEDIDKNYGDPPGEPYVATIRDTQRKEYCISAPLRSTPDKHYCVDATAAFKVVSGPCPEEVDKYTPLRCPSS